MTAIANKINEAIRTQEFWMGAGGAMALITGIVLIVLGANQIFDGSAWVDRSVFLVSSPSQTLGLLAAGGVLAGLGAYGLTSLLGHQIKKKVVSIGADKIETYNLWSRRLNISFIAICVIVMAILAVLAIQMHATAINGPKGNLGIFFNNGSAIYRLNCGAPATFMGAIVSKDAMLLGCAATAIGIYVVCQGVNFAMDEIEKRRRQLPLANEPIN